MVEMFWKPNGTSIAKRYVANLDVLGFKQQLFRDGLSAVFSNYQGLQVYLKHGGTKFTLLGTLFGTTVGLSGAAPYMLISDTILLWCDENGDVESFVEVCGSIIANASTTGMFLRGAIAFGETIIDPLTSTFLGQPLVDAYIAEQSQEWVGLGIHPTAVDGLRKSESTVSYRVPVKRCRPALTHAVTWHHYLQVSDAITRLEKARAAAGKNGKKYKEAIKFVRAFPLDKDGV